MKKIPIWKPILIIAILALSLLLIYPPEQRLQGGLDIVGGTRLVYQVDIPPEQQARADRIIEDVIAVQRDRVDPQGVMNLIWRRLDGNRIEIQMPLASPEVRRLRQNWTEARDALLVDNLDPELVTDVVLRDRDRREARFLEAVGAESPLLEPARQVADARREVIDAEARVPWLEADVRSAREDVDDAHEDELEQARQALEEAEARLEEGRETVAAAREALAQAREAAPQQRIDQVNLLADLLVLAEFFDRWRHVSEQADQAEQDYQRADRAMRQAEDDQQRQAAEAEREQAESRAIELAARARAIQRQVTELRDAVQRRNLTESELMSALTQSGEPPAGDRRATPPRERAIATLKERFPTRADQIEAAASAWIAYEGVRGPLDDPADLVRLMRGSGVLEFRIVPRVDEIDPSPYVDRLEEEGPFAGRHEDFIWRELTDLEHFADEPRDREALMAPRGDETLEQYQERVKAFFAREGGGHIVEVWEDRFFMLVSNREAERITPAEPDWEVVSAGPTTDERGFPAVSFRLDPRGGQYMARLTGANVNRTMGVILDGEVMTVPVIRSPLHRNVMISRGSGYSESEMRFLIRTLAAGSLAGRMGEEPISMVTIAPSAGAANLERGLTSAVWALCLVAAAIGIYYLFAGAVTVFALLFNMSLLLAVMVALQGTFTLPGIAGIVLTIGIAVDANVLIFERIREELFRKVDLRTAVKLGYEKAFSTILDANVTTLITCVVLYYTATAEVRGFALTLMIGVLASMFTALFASRVIIEYYIRFFKPRTLHMTPTVFPGLHRLLEPNLNWLGKTRLFVIVSLVLMVGATVAIINRGSDILSIEFRGGTDASFTLAEGERLTVDEATGLLDDVARRRMAEDAEYLELTRERVTLLGIGDTDAQRRYSQFAVQTVIQNQHRVRDAVVEAFRPHLDRQPTLRFAGTEVDEGEVLEDHIRVSPMGTAPPERHYVFPIRQREGLRRAEGGLLNLGDVLRRPGVDRPIPPDFVGGVAIVLDDVMPDDDRPGASLSEVRGRIEQMRQHPPFNRFAVPTWRLYPLDPVPAEEVPEGSEALFSSFVMLATDDQTNYQLRPEEFDRRDDEALAAREWQLALAALTRDEQLDSVTQISGQVSRDMQFQAAQAIFLSLLAVVIYIWARFGSVRYGLAAIAALVHDVLIALGLIAVTGFIYNTAFGQALLLEPFRIDLALVAAMLTLIGYSLNDTIVIFDRIRENRGKLAHATPSMINLSLNQTFSRTVVTSSTTLLALLTLYIFGGTGSLHGFAFAMIVGVLIGTYSSIAVACPLLLLRQPLPAAKPTLAGTPATT